MITTKELQYPVSLMETPSVENHLELARLLAAAIINPAFCRLLLIDPKQAIDSGYQGETFFLADAERYLLLSIHADTLAELAQHIVQALDMSLRALSSSFAQRPDPIGI